MTRDLKPEVPAITPQIRSGISRLTILSSMLGGVLIGGVACASNGSVVLPRAQAAGSLSTNDIAILNFALQLEYLEAEFYSNATGNGNLPAGMTSGTGTAGATTGGAAVNFTDTVTGQIASEIYADEKGHVTLLRTVLGSSAVAKPAINLAALGANTGAMNQFLVLSRAFEDTGVTAYGGAAGGLVDNATILTAAATILAVEAYHAGSIRTLIVQQGISVTPPGALDGKDILPSAAQYFPANAATNFTAQTRTVAEVVAIVKPFFPNGLN